MFVKSKVFILALCLFWTACSVKKEGSPLETLKVYGNAFKKKDVTSMKLLLSDASLKMLDQEAKVQGSNVDEVILRETLFTDSQRSAEFRNLKIEDGKATLDMKDSLGMWTTVFFVKEDGEWKLDKRGIADDLLRQSEESTKQLDALINGNKQ